MKCAACGYEKEEGWKKIEIMGGGFACFGIREYGNIRLFSCPVCKTVRIE